MSISSNCCSTHTHTHTPQTNIKVTGMLCWPTPHNAQAHTLLQHNYSGHLTFLFCFMTALCPIDLKRAILIVSAVYRALKGTSGRTTRGQWPTQCCQLQRENPLMKNSFTSLPCTEKKYEKGKAVLWDQQVRPLMYFCGTLLGQSQIFLSFFMQTEIWWMW